VSGWTSAETVRREWLTRQHPPDQLPQRQQRRRFTGRYFARDCDWWVCEYDPATGTAFGYARLHGDDTNAEWGYVNLPELEALHQQGSITRTDTGRLRLLPRLIVERDLHWTPRTVREAQLPDRHAQP